MLPAYRQADRLDEYDATDHGNSLAYECVPIPALTLPLR